MGENHNSYTLIRLSALVIIAVLVLSTTAFAQGEYLGEGQKGTIVGASYSESRGSSGFALGFSTSATRALDIGLSFGRGKSGSSPAVWSFGPLMALHVIKSYGPVGSFFLTGRASYEHVIYKDGRSWFTTQNEEDGLVKLGGTAATDLRIGSNAFIQLAVSVMRLNYLRGIRGSKEKWAETYELSIGGRSSRESDKRGSSPVYSFSVQRFGEVTTYSLSVGFVSSRAW